MWDNVELVRTGMEARGGWHRFLLLANAYYIETSAWPIGDLCSSAHTVARNQKGSRPGATAMGIRWEPRRVSRLYLNFLSLQSRRLGMLSVCRSMYRPETGGTGLKRTTGVAGAMQVSFKLCI